MSTHNPPSWQLEEPRPPKVQPWTAFGFMMILAIASLLFAAATWIVRGHQSSRAVAKAAAVQEQLEEVEAEVEALNRQSAEDQAALGELRNKEAALTEEGRKLGGELASAKRDLDAAQHALNAAQQRDVDPAALPAASLSDVLGPERNVAVFVQVSDDRNQVGVGAVSSYIKQRLAMAKTPLAIADDAPTMFIVSIVIATAADNASVGILMELRHRWKVPGLAKSFTISSWRSHTIGITPRDAGLAKFVEDLVENLVEGFEKELDKGG